MDYSFDVFVSYSHHEDHAWWVRNVFKRRFETYLANALGRSPKVFYDRPGIESGDAWPERLKGALAQSRILVPVWSVEYFESDWCTAECAVIWHREHKLGYRTLENPQGLIHPIQLYDGDHYPNFASKIQYRSFKRFNRVGEGFLNSPRYSELQDELEEWVEQVAPSIRNAPEWRDEWLSKEWLDDAIAEARANPDFHVKKEFAGPPSMV